MAQMNQPLLTILLLVCIALLALSLSTGGETDTDAILSATLANAPPDPVTSKDVTPPGTTGPRRSVSEFSEMIDRPLFSQSRRPAAATNKAQSDEQPLQRLPVEKQQLAVMGIIITGDEKIALLRDPHGNGDVIRAREGQIVSGWQIDSIDPESLKLTNQGTTNTLRLRDNVLSAAEKLRLMQRSRQAKTAAEAASGETAGQRRSTPRVRNPRNRPNTRVRRLPPRPSPQVKTPVR